MSRVCASAASLGRCNTMGTASTMNALAEALGMSLQGCAAIPAPFRERMAMAYQTGKRSVELVHEDLKPSDILTRAALIYTLPTGKHTGSTFRFWSICSPLENTLGKRSTERAGFRLLWAN